MTTRVASVCAISTALALAVTSTALAQSDPDGGLKIVDKAALHAVLQGLGHTKHGGIDRRRLDQGNPHNEALPTFSSSFTFNGVAYPYTMLGYPPMSGRTAELRSVIIPLRFHFYGFGPNHDISVDFDPMPAVKNIVNSPIYRDAQFPNGVGQFGDMLQRATFWNKMDAQRRWHVRMAAPRVADPVDIYLSSSAGKLYQVGNDYLGSASGSVLGNEVYSIVQVMKLEPDELAMFVTGNVFSGGALGWHDGYNQENPDGTVSTDWHTVVFASWLDPRLVDPLYADISTVNHEVGEWLNDPFINNVVPNWAYPPPNDPLSSCAYNYLLEVGDPQGNGATSSEFPPVVIPLNGYPYHLQDLVMLPWFAGEIPSSAENGWYDFPGTNQITAPAVLCQ